MEKIASVGFEMLVKGHQADACLRIQVLVPEQQKAVRQGPAAACPASQGLALRLGFVAFLYPVGKLFLHFLCLRGLRSLPGAVCRNALVVFIRCWRCCGV